MLDIGARKLGEMYSYALLLEGHTLLLFTVIRSQQDPAKLSCPGHHGLDQLLETDILPQTLKTGERYRRKVMCRAGEGRGRGWPSSWKYNYGEGCLEASLSLQRQTGEYKKPLEISESFP